MHFLIYGTFHNKDTSKVITEGEAREVLAAIFPGVEQTSHSTKEDDNAYITNCDEQFMRDLRSGYAERKHGDWTFQAETY